ncbi:hypothetical protein C8J56DRAFT_762647, partial [Mycena floridula]
GRASRAFEVYDKTSQAICFYKQGWYTKQFNDEAETMRKLQALGVPHTPTVLGGAPLGNRTRTQDHVDMAWNLNRERNVNIDDIFKRVDRFVLMKEVGRPLWSFSSVEELLQVTRDAFVAHRDAYVKGNILHGDISEGNILIYRGRGLLIDWEM